MKLAIFTKLAVVPLMGAAVVLTGVAIQAQTAPQKTTAKEKAAATATIDLNKATAEELEELPGVGPATAKKIIAGRPYSKVDDLAKAGVPARVITAIRSKVHVGEATAAKSKAKSAGATEPKAKSEKVNLNTADSAALEDLPGIGPAHAKAIIAARPFKSVDDLERVKGLGKARIDALKDLVTTTARRRQDRHGQDRPPRPLARPPRTCRSSRRARRSTSTPPRRKSSTCFPESARSEPRQSSMAGHSRPSKTS